MMKRCIPVLLLWLLCCITNIQAQDFRISKFKENMLDLSAASAAVKDRNGDVCAIIKFSSRDTKFVFEPNMGAVKTEKRVGETWLYVPPKTKRITIRHPQLGILRDYAIPVDIEQKMVYEAEIEITNKEYLNSLLESKTDTVRIVQMKDTVIYREKERQSHTIIGVGFNALSIMGPSAFLGFHVKGHLLEAGVTLGLGKAMGISIYQADNAAFWGTYDYKPLRFFARYGYDFTLSSWVVTPQVGMALTNINGTEIHKGATGSNLFEKSHAVSATVGCRISYRLGKAVRLQLTPEYDVAVKKSNGYNILKDFDSKVKSWGSGININAGVAFYL